MPTPGCPRRQAPSPRESGGRWSANRDHRDSTSSLLNVVLLHVAHDGRIRTSGILITRGHLCFDGAAVALDVVLLVVVFDDVLSVLVSEPQPEKQAHGGGDGDNADDVLYFMC